VTVTVKASDTAEAGAPSAAAAWRAAAVGVYAKLPSGFIVTVPWAGLDTV
jgi:hypothetical protein